MFILENENKELRKEMRNSILKNNNSNNNNAELKGSYVSEEDVTFMQNEHADIISKLAETTDALNECKIKKTVLEERLCKMQKDNAIKKQEYEWITRDF